VTGPLQICDKEKTHRHKGRRGVRCSIGGLPALCVLLQHEEMRAGDGDARFARIRCNARESRQAAERRKERVPGPQHEAGDAHGIECGPEKVDARTDLSAQRKSGPRRRRRWQRVNGARRCGSATTWRATRPAGRPRWRR